MLEDSKTPLIIQPLATLYRNLTPLGYTVLRTIAGAMIATFGASKLFTEDGAQMDIDIIRQIGFEPAEIWASFVIWLESLDRPEGWRRDVTRPADRPRTPTARHRQPVSTLAI